MLKNRLIKILTTRFTLMLIPHGSGKSRKLVIPLSLIAFFMVTWTGVTFWGSYLSAQHVDYWRTEIANKMLQRKVQYLVNQMDKSREFLDEVKQIEGELRTLLEYKNKFSIISNEKSMDSASTATGGPTFWDQKDVAEILRRKGKNISWERLVGKVNLMKNEAEGRIASFDDLSSWIDRQRTLFRATPRGWPSPGSLSSHFGRRRDPFTRIMEHHYGVDIAGPMGTPIRATADGKVKMSKWHSGYGKLIVLQHKFGYSTRYAHNGRLLVRVGDEVKRGQVIALMGNTGKSSGPHCHYEVWRYSKRLNPYAYLKSDFPKIGSLSKISSKSTSTRSNNS